MAIQLVPQRKIHFLVRKMLLLFRTPKTITAWDAQIRLVCLYQTEDAIRQCCVSRRAEWSIRYKEKCIVESYKNLNLTFLNLKLETIFCRELTVYTCL